MKGRRKRHTEFPVNPHEEALEISGVITSRQKIVKRDRLAQLSVVKGEVVEGKAVDKVVAQLLRGTLHHHTAEGRSGFHIAQQKLGVVQLPVAEISKLFVDALALDEAAADGLGHLHSKVQRTVKLARREDAVDAAPEGFQLVGMGISGELAACGRFKDKHFLTALARLQVFQFGVGIALRIEGRVFRILCNAAVAIAEEEDIQVAALHVRAALLPGAAVFGHVVFHVQHAEAVFEWAEVGQHGIPVLLQVAEGRGEIYGDQGGHSAFKGITKGAEKETLL